MSDSEQGGREAIDVLDKIIASNERIKALVEKCAASASKADTEEKRQNKAVRSIIFHYSNLSALGGGVSGIPGIIPGIGVIFSVFGAGAVDAILALKFEIELVLALSYLAGIDIDNPKERKIAYLMACSSLQEAFESKRNPNVRKILDIAISEYSTRELSKSLIKAVSKVIFTITAKRWTRAFPVVGMFIGATVNKALTSHLGNECWKMIKARKGE